MVFQNKNSETYHTYEYTDAGWSDLLTAFDGGAITYDNIGNPLTYHDGKTFTWTAGRRLSGVTDGESSYTYAYDGDGNRISKTVNGETTEFVYVDGKLLGLQKGQDKLQFLYDETDTAYGFLRNGTPYYYDKNLQGDIIGIYDRNGSRVATYTYDVWGLPEFISDNALPTLNPLRYRGYFYDDETGFYYLQSRYYDPEVGRFISSDNQLTTGSNMTGTNLFAYCGNNPVNRIDPTGEAWWHWALGAAVVAACAVATVVTCGGFAAAVGAVAAVGSGFAAATTAATVAAGAFIGSATVYGMAVLSAVSTSNSVQEFNDQGNWGTVAATAFGGLTGGCDGYTMSKAQTPTSTSTGKGTQNSKVKAAVQKGQAMHKQMDYGPGVLKEQPIAPGCRVDGIDFNNRIIYELKPNNPQAIARGMNQLNRYTSAARQQFGGTWTGVLKLYD